MIHKMTDSVWSVESITNKLLHRICIEELEAEIAVHFDHCQKLSRYRGPLLLFLMLHGFRTAANTLCPLVPLMFGWHVRVKKIEIEAFIPICICRFR